MTARPGPGRRTARRSAPIGRGRARRLGVQRRNRGLQCKGPESSRRQGALDQRNAFLYLRLIPSGPVLLLERDQLTRSGRTGRAPGVMQQHQREQSHRLGLGKQVDEKASQADRLGREVGASEVALIEDEIDDVQHARETIREGRTLGDVVGDPGVADLGLGANDALGQRRRGDEKGRRDLLGRESANLAQRHGDLCIGIQCRVTAGENEAKAVIYHVVVLDLGSLLRYIEFTGGFGPALAQPADRTEASRRNQPGPRAGRYAFYRPALDRRRERILKRLLGEIEVAEETNQSGQNAAGFGPVDRLDRVYGWLNSMIGRTSMVPCFAPGIRDATCTASFRSFALIR